VVFRRGRAPSLELTALQSTPVVPIDAPPLVLRETDGRRTAELRALRLAMGFPPGAA